MEPVHPPLPLARNFLFQPEAGIHTSIRISESLEGLSVAATRQNAGKSGKADALGVGGAKRPASIVRATVISASGGPTERRPSQGAPAADNRAATSSQASTRTMPIIRQ